MLSSAYCSDIDRRRRLDRLRLCNWAARKLGVKRCDFFTSLNSHFHFSTRAHSLTHTHSRTQTHIAHAAPHTHSVRQLLSSVQTIKRINQPLHRHMCTHVHRSQGWGYIQRTEILGRVQRRERAEGTDKTHESERDYLRRETAQVWGFVTRRLGGNPAAF